MPGRKERLDALAFQEAAAKTVRFLEG